MRRSTAMVISSLFPGTNLMIAPATPASLMSSLFSRKMESFFKKATASSRSSGFLRWSIWISMGVMLRFFIFRSTLMSSARFNRTWKHTYKSLSCFFSVIFAFLSSFSFSSPLSCPARAWSSSLRCASRFISNSTTFMTMSPILCSVSVGWNVLKFENAKKTYTRLIMRSMLFLASSRNTRVTTPMNWSFAMSSSKLSGSRTNWSIMKVPLILSSIASSYNSSR
mmetsp:Transcript_45408/g.106655  ORF Transcript_45408/g.106655 Transcript_45408/m.106655 type:complete len:224 (-) Transcript_45408:22-693(-)